MAKRFRERPENGLLMTTNNGRSRKEPTVLFAPAAPAEGSPQPNPRGARLRRVEAGQR